MTNALLGGFLSNWSDYSVKLGFTQRTRKDTGRCTALQAGGGCGFRSPGTGLRACPGAAPLDALGCSQRELAMQKKIERPGGCLSANTFNQSFQTINLNNVHDDA